jgi:hypothetical protein
MGYAQINYPGMLICGEIAAFGGECFRKRKEGFLNQNPFQ